MANPPKAIITPSYTYATVTSPGIGTRIRNFLGQILDFDPDTFTLTQSAGSSVSVDFSVNFPVGYYVIHSIYTDQWATVVSSTPTEAVLSGPIGGVRSGNILWSGTLVATDPADAFTVTVDDAGGTLFDFTTTNPIKVGQYYNSGCGILPKYMSDVVEVVNNNTLRLDRPRSVAVNEQMFINSSLGEKAYSLNDCCMMQYYWYGPDGSGWDIWLGMLGVRPGSVSNDAGYWGVEWDGYVDAPENQTAEQIYNRAILQVQKINEILSENYTSFGTHLQPDLFPGIVYE